MKTLQEINSYTENQFINVFGDIFEHSPWIAKKAIEFRPFQSIEHVYESMRKIVEEARSEEKETLILKHPELGSRISMSESSMNEQASAGLNALTHEEYNYIMNLNKQYKEKFNFPFIIAVSGLDKHSIMKEMEYRNQNDKTSEFNTAMNEIFKIAKIRFDAIIG